MRYASLVRLGSVAIALCAAAGSAAAQDADTLRQKFLLPLPPTTVVAEQASRGSPGSSAASPTAFGASFGDGFVGAGFQSRTRYTKNLPRRDQVDGSVVTGFGLGDPLRYVGLEVAVTSFSTIDSGFYTRSGVSFKAHRVLPGNLGVAVGWENAIVMGQEGDGGNSIFGVVTKVVSLQDSPTMPFSSLTISAGAGNGRFRTEDDVKADKKTINAFGSVGVRVIEPASVVADWSGQDLTLALSIVPFRSLPLVITPALADVTGTAGDGARFTIGAGMGFKFSSLTHLF